MNSDELRKYADELVAPKTRWLAIIAGCVSGLAGSLSFGPLFSMVAVILICSAVLQRWSPRPGRWGMWLGAFFVTVDVGVFLGPAVLRPPHFLDTNSLVVLSFFIASIVLVGWCDVALIVDSLRPENLPGPANQRFPRMGDWLVGALAVGLTASSVGSILASSYPVRHYHLRGISAFAVVFVTAVAAFDIALVTHALKMYRSRRSEGAV